MSPTAKMPGMLLSRYSSTTTPRSIASLAYVGHAEHWDKAEIAGSLEGRDCAITYRRGGRKLAVAVVHRDLEGLHAEAAFERVIAKNSDGGRTAKSATAPAQQPQAAIGGS
jgi:hypothetical protein